MFSENIISGKLVLSFLNENWEVDIISKKDDGELYSQDWIKPFDKLRPITNEIIYSRGNLITRLFDFLYSSLFFGFYPLQGVRWARRAYLKALRMMEVKEYDVIMSRSPSDIAHLVGYKLSKKTGKPWMVNWNDPAATIWPSPYKQKISFVNRFIQNRYIKKVIVRADINTFPSDTLRDHFIEHFPMLRDEKCEVIPHISLQGFYRDKQIGISNKKDTFRICHCGNLSNERSPEELFKALVKLKNEHSIQIRFDIMGFINDYTNDLINKYDLSSEVKFIGGYPFLDALNTMASYDLLLLIEAKMDFGIFFPTKIVDYSQAEVPILAISPKYGFCNNLFLEFNSGISVDNEDFDAIARALMKFYNSFHASEPYGAYNFQALNDYLSPTEILKKYKRIFQDLIP